MKRSHINYAVDKAHAIAETFRVCLPDFAYFTIDAWRQQDQTLWREVRALQLGWDVTDFGRGDFAQTGLTLLTLRNGQPVVSGLSQTVRRKDAANSAGSANAMAFSSP